MSSACTRIRVRYPEVDRMGVAHHSHFLIWFETGRTELLRGMGCTYREMETAGIFMPVVEASCRYLSPVRYDDLLEVETRLEEVAASRIEFRYQLRRAESEELLARGSTVHATVDRKGRVIRLPVAYRNLLAPSR